MGASAAPLRVFLDSGVILEGCYSLWGASKGVLILAAQRRRDMCIVLAEAVEREVRRDLTLALTKLPPERVSMIINGFDGWLSRVQIEHLPLPSEDEILAHYGQIMPVLRHVNDVPQWCQQSWRSPIGSSRPIPDTGMRTWLPVRDCISRRRNTFCRNYHYK